MSETKYRRVELRDGKYSVVKTTAGPSIGTMRAYRYGEEWRDITGDNLISALVDKVEDLQEQRDALLEAMEALQDDGIWGVAHEKAEQAMANARENE